VDPAGGSVLEPGTGTAWWLRVGPQRAAPRLWIHTALSRAAAVNMARLAGTATGPSSENASPISGAVAMGPTEAAANTAGETCSARPGNLAVSQARPVANVGASAKPTTPYMTGAIGMKVAPIRAATATASPTTSTFPGA